MSTARKILSNTFIQVVGKVGVGFFSLITSVLLASYLTKAERGMYEFAYMFLGFAGIAADLGLYTIAIRELAKNKEKMEETIGNILSIRLVLSILVVVASLLVISFVPAFQKGWGVMFLIALGLAGISTIFALLTGALTSVLQVEYDMLHATIAQVVGKIVIVSIFCISIFLLYAKPSPGYAADTTFLGFQALFLAGVIGNIVMFFYTRHVASAYVRIRFLFNWEFWKRIIKESLPYGFALVLATLYFKIDALLLYFFLPKEIVAEELALYSAPIKVIEIFTILPLFFLNALLPALSESIKTKSKDVSAMIQYSFDFLFLMSAPIVAGGWALSREVIRVTNSDAYISNLQTGFVGSDIYLQILIFTIVFSFLNLLFNFLLIAQDNQKKLIIVNCTTLVLNVVANIICIPIWGVKAAAIITVISEIIVLVMTYYYARKGLEFHLRAGKFLKIALAAVSMAVLLKYLEGPLFSTMGKYPAMLIALMIGGTTYLLLLIALRVVDKEMLRKLKR
ncbi:MAG: flippase [Candidatus Gracilibacteria bacterium]